MIVPLIPCIGQFALTRRFYAEAGDVSLVIVLIRTGYKGGFRVTGLDQDLDLRILHVTANGTASIPVKGVLALACEMHVVTAVSAVVPVVGGIPIPCRHRSDTMTVLFGVGIVMLISKMLVPIHVFHANPLAAVTSRKIRNILTANQAEVAVITDARTLGAVFLAVGADNRTILAGTAVLADQHTLRTQIAAFAERIRAFQTSFPTALAQRSILNVAFTTGAMEARGNGTIDAKLLGGIKIGTVTANAAFGAEFSTAFAVALRAIGAVHIIVDCTFDADYRTGLLTAVQTGRTAIHTLAAFFTPAANLKITLVAVGAVMAVTDGTFLTNHRTCFTGAALVDLHTVAAQTALLTPAGGIEIADVAAGTMASFVRGTIFANHHSVDTGALLVQLHTVAAHTALLAPARSVKIAAVAAGAMGSFVCGAFYANHHSVDTGALLVQLHTVAAHTTLFAPARSGEIASITTGTVGTFFNSTLQAYIVADLLVGTAVADLRAGAIGALTAFNTQIHAGITLIALLAVR